MLDDDEGAPIRPLLARVDAGCSASPGADPVAHRRLGTQGFGFDPIVVPFGHEITTAQMTAEAKDAIYHRGRTMRALAPVLRELLSQ